jgi:hypothetical protein
MAYSLEMALQLTVDLVSAMEWFCTFICRQVCHARATIIVLYNPILQDRGVKGNSLSEKRFLRQAIKFE